VVGHSRAQTGVLAVLERAEQDPEDSDTRDRLLRSLNDDRRGLRARGFAIIGAR